MSRQNSTIIGLMIPFFSLVLNMSMFTVAVPAIRDDFGLLADTASWVVMAYTIPYVLFMPFHGRLGDLLGARNLIVVGMIVFAAGTAVCMLAPGLGLLFAGRLIQAAGGASVNPLSLAIISRHFDSESRGRAMGTWNAAGPLTGIIGPVIAGVIIDALSWRSIFVPMLAAAGLAITGLFLLVPKDPKTDEERSLKGFDWIGMILTATTLTSFVLFLSSRPVTGRAPFTDWRLFLVFATSATAWIVHERRRSVPFVAIELFAKRQFSFAAASVSVRMILLGALNFLVPLYAADVLGIPSAQTGIMITLHSAALLVTMRFGGSLADSWNRKWPVVIGLTGQTLMLLVLALEPGASRVGLIVPMMLHGSFAGLSLASLHRVALHEVPAESAGVGAGTYSMSRFIGSLLGASVMGIALEATLSTAVSVSAAYRSAFLIAAGLGVLGILPALGIKSGRTRAAAKV